MVDGLQPEQIMEQAPRNSRSGLRRHAANLAARCAMASWLVLVAMPIVAVVCALS